jgi:hypothetical protein
MSRVVQSYPHSNVGSARTIETTWFALSDGGDSLIEPLVGVSGGGEFGLTRDTLKLVIFVYMPGSATTWYVIGPVSAGAWHTSAVVRNTPTSWRVDFDNVTRVNLAGLGGGYLSDVATGNETLLYSGQGYNLRMYGYTGVNPKFLTVFGVWVDGYPGGWQIHETHGSPFFGAWYCWYVGQRQ